MRQFYRACFADPPLVLYGTTFLLKGSMSLDSQSPTAPYESSSFATPLRGGTMDAREALIKSLSDFILVFLFNARNQSTRIASYLRRLMRSIG